MANNQIFVSYSRKNIEHVERLTNDLRGAGFHVWRDTDNLIPGTSNWEKAIRNAIKESAAVVYVASPNALESEYVQGELTVAQLYNCPIYSIWAEGTNWIECVPLVMVKHQYVDARDNYTTGLNSLLESLKRVTDTSKGVIKIGLPTHETIDLNLALFDKAVDLLNYLYVRHLALWYDSLSYGEDWILGNVETKQVGVTWDWLHVNRTSKSERLDYYMKAGELKIRDFGIEDGSYWAVWDARRVRIAGVAVRDNEIAKTILTVDGERELLRLSSLNKLVLTPPNMVQFINKQHYPTKFMMALFQANYDNCAFIQP